MLQRRKRHAAIGLIALAVFVSTYLESHGQWTHRAGSAGHASYSAESFDATQIALAWHAPLNFNPIPYDWDSRGVVVENGRLFFTALDGQSVNGKFYVTALDLASGAMQWQFSVDSYSYSGVSQPVVQDGR